MIGGRFSIKLRFSLTWPADHHQLASPVRRIELLLPPSAEVRSVSYEGDGADACAELHVVVIDPAGPVKALRDVSRVVEIVAMQEGHTLHQLQEAKVVQLDEHDDGPPREPIPEE